MSGLVQSIRSALLNHLFGKSTMTAPTMYLGLSVTEPSSTGANVTEPTEGGYARIATTPADWNIAVDGDPCIVDNANALTFGRALGNWASGQNLAYGVLFDAASGGGVVGSGPLATAKPVYTDDTAQYAAGYVQITLAGS